MTQNSSHVLVVNSDAISRNTIVDDLNVAGYSVEAFGTANEAWEYLTSHSSTDMVVVDNKTTDMSGMEFFERLRRHDTLKNIPVILQIEPTEASNEFEYIKAGIYYCITKPMQKGILLSILSSAQHDARNRNEILDSVHKTRDGQKLMVEGRFMLKTINDAKNLSYFIANCYPDPEAVVMGLSEFIVNAVEHGNLGITYEEKRTMMLNNTFEEEIENRLAMAENKDKVVELTFEHTAEEIVVCIVDQGKGFDWEKYEDIDTERVEDPNGRGIALARMTFDEVKYFGIGNEVRCVYKL